MESCLRWVGGKKTLSPILSSYLPVEIKQTKKIKKYHEPFLGAGHFFFYLLNFFKIKYIYISDINQDLICLYQNIRDYPNELCYYLDNIIKEYNDNVFFQHIYYNEMRKKFNNMKDNQILKSALFLFLNKTCYNGLYRVNQRGEFTSSFNSRYKKISIDKNNIYKISNNIKHAKIHHYDYKESLSFIDSHSFVYLDPPYMDSWSYNLDFNYLDFIDYLNLLDIYNTKFLLSFNKYDNFINKFASKYNIYSVTSLQHMNHNKTMEFIITNY